MFRFIFVMLKSLYSNYQYEKQIIQEKNELANELEYMKLYINISESNYKNLTNSYATLKNEYNIATSECDYYKMRYEQRKNAIYTLL